MPHGLFGQHASCGFKTMKFVELAAKKFLKHKAGKNMCEQWGLENTKRRASKIHVNADMSHGSAAHASDVDSSDARLGDAV